MSAQTESIDSLFCADGWIGNDPDGKLAEVKKDLQKLEAYYAQRKSDPDNLGNLAKRLRDAKTRRQRLDSEIQSTESELIKKACARFNLKNHRLEDMHAKPVTGGVMIFWSPMRMMVPEPILLIRPNGTTVDLWEPERQDILFGHSLD